MAETQQEILYVYRAVNPAGKRVKGTIHAVSESAAAAELVDRDLTPIWVKDNSTMGLSRELDLSFLQRKPKLSDLAVASKQLAVMVSAGIPLMRVLHIMSEQTTQPQLRKGFADVQRDVSQGMSMSDSMEQQPKVFPPLMVSLTRVGETGGFLDQALTSAAGNFESELKLKQKIVSAAAYPIVVLGVAVLSVIAMLVFVVPTFESMFSSFGSELPLPTLILVGLSRSAMWWLPPLVLLPLVGAWLYQRYKGEEWLRKLRDTIMLKIPVFGPLFQKVALTRFTRNLAVMLHAGVPMLQAIELVAKVSNNWVIEQALKDAENSVRHGRPFAQPLGSHPVFPPMVTQMVAVGEDSGALDTMLESVAGFYTREVDATADQLTSLIEPILIVLIGVVIGAMVVALYLPIFMMVTTVQG